MILFWKCFAKSFWTSNLKRLTKFFRNFYKILINFLQTCKGYFVFLYIKHFPFPFILTANFNRLALGQMELDKRTFGQMAFNVICKCLKTSKTQHCCEEWHHNIMMNFFTVLAMIQTAGERYERVWITLIREH
jgi:hypothetical protein